MNTDSFVVLLVVLVTLSVIGLSMVVDFTSKKLKDDHKAYKEDTTKKCTPNKFSGNDSFMSNTDARGVRVVQNGLSLTIYKGCTSITYILTKEESEELGISLVEASKQ